MTKGCGNDEVSDGIKCFDGLQTASPTLRRHSHKNRNLKFRHSRAGGNPDLRTTAIFKDYLKV
ncbi:hypothetical protein NEIPOLOT_02016 [Neisseria polysaccharea ATCC 43768]|nr:hypothetical protein NEIPOLOT_02016 [Neisseria polysaccharea ATCC 43768]